MNVLLETMNVNEKEVQSSLARVLISLLLINESGRAPHVIAKAVLQVQNLVRKFEHECMNYFAYNVSDQLTHPIL